MTTRQGHAGDFQAVAPLMQRYRLRNANLDPVLYEPHPDAERRFLRWMGELAEDPRSMLLLAEEQGRVIGYMSISIQKNPPVYRCEEYALLRGWWVEAEFRQGGAVRALVDHAARELAAIGIRQVRVRAPEGDQDARALFSDCGFRAAICEMVMEL